MPKDLFDHRRIFDARDAVQGCTNAASAGCARAATFTAPPQCSQVSISILNTRCNRCAHVIETWRAGGGSPLVAASRRPRLAGVTAADSQEAVLQAAALQIVLKLALHMRRQAALTRRQVCHERRVVGFNQLIQERLLGPVTVALSARATQAPASLPANNGVMHRVLAIPYEPIV